MRRGHGGPQEFYGVEYLETDGQCYIDTDYVPQDGDKIYYAFRVFSAPGTGITYSGDTVIMSGNSVAGAETYILGADSVGICSSLYKYNSLFSKSLAKTVYIKMPLGYDNFNTGQFTLTSSNNMYTAPLSGVVFGLAGKMTISATPEFNFSIYQHTDTSTISLPDSATTFNNNDSSAGAFTFPNPIHSLYLFATHYVDDGAEDGDIPEVYKQSYAGSKIYGLAVERDGSEILKFVPAKTSDNVYGVFETHNEIFYSNSDVGTFASAATTSDIFYGEIK